MRWRQFRPRRRPGLPAASGAGALLPAGETHRDPGAHDGVRRRDAGGSAGCAGGNFARDDGQAFLLHPALERFYPPEKRIVIPERMTECGGVMLAEALDALAAISPATTARPSCCIRRWSASTRRRNAS